MSNGLDKVKQTKQFLQIRKTVRTIITFINTNPITTLFLVCLVITVPITILFFCNQVYDIELTLATDIFGQYGDFFGGVIGSTISIFLLYLTLKSQLKESSRNSQTFKIQQLNETFFYLLNQYNTIIANLKCADNEKKHGKEALHHYLNQIRNNDDNLSISRKKAISYFQEFYSSHPSFAPIYYRTLYRILDTIEKSEIDDKVKSQYVKLIRAQLTDSELVFIRYNAMTKIGKKMIDFINKYNLLKHLSILDLLEHKKLRLKFNQLSLSQINTILYTIKETIYDLFDGEHLTLASTSAHMRYNVNVSRSKNYKQFSLDFNRNYSAKKSNYDDFYCFEDVDIEVIADIFENFLKEVFVFSNFDKLNSSRLSFDTSVPPLQNSKEHFTIKIWGKKGLKVKHSNRKS